MAPRSSFSLLYGPTVIALQSGHDGVVTHDVVCVLYISFAGVMLTLCCPSASEIWDMAAVGIPIILPMQIRSVGDLSLRTAGSDP